MLEHAIKAVELAARYSWAFSVAIAFVLFVPKDAAIQIGVLPIRELYLGYLWIGLVTCSALFVSAIVPVAKQSITAFTNRRTEVRVAAATKSKREGTLLSRLRSLGPEELLWVQYCLYFGQQTVFGEAHHPLAHALIKKGLVAGGSGTVWRVSYSMIDDVWMLANEHIDELLPASEREDPKVGPKLKLLEKMLRPKVL